jgi:hypothetical protein
MTVAYVMNAHVDGAFDQRSIDLVNTAYDCLALTADPSAGNPGPKRRSAGDLVLGSERMDERGACRNNHVPR